MTKLQIQKLLPIFLVAIPFLLIALSLGLIYLPYLYTPKPQVDFIYLDEDILGCQAYFVYVENGKLMKKANRNTQYCPDKDQSNIYYHNVVENRSRKISFEEAQKLSLEKNSKSPDGFTLDDQYSSSGGFLFPYSSSSAMFLIKDSISFKQDLDTDTYNTQFLGWVLK